MTNSINRLKVDAVKIKVLKHLLEFGGTSKTELMLRVRQYIPEYRKLAFDELIENSQVECSVVESMRPGPNPTLLKITKGGERLLGNLREQYKI